MSTKQHRRKCDWRAECETPATILGAKGYLYCEDHREHRRGVEATRVLKKWELARIEDGLTLVSWAASRAETAAHDAAVIAQAAASETAQPTAPESE